MLKKIKTIILLNLKIKNNLENILKNIVNFKINLDIEKSIAIMINSKILKNLGVHFYGTRFTNQIQKIKLN